EVVGAFLVTLGEVAVAAPAHRVDEVIGDRNALEGRSERVRLQHLGASPLTSGLPQVVGFLGRASQRPDLLPTLCDVAGQQSADVSGCSDDSDHGNQVPQAPKIKLGKDAGSVACSARERPKTPSGADLQAPGSAVKVLGARDLAELRAVVRRLDTAHGAGAGAHHQRFGRRAFAAVADALEDVAVGHAGGGEEDVLAGAEVVAGE